MSDTPETDRAEPSHQDIIEALGAQIADVGETLAGVAKAVERCTQGLVHVHSKIDDTREASTDHFDRALTRVEQALSRRVGDLEQAVARAAGRADALAAAAKWLADHGWEMLRAVFIAALAAAGATFWRASGDDPPAKEPAAIVEPAPSPKKALAPRGASAPLPRIKPERSIAYG